MRLNQPNRCGYLDALKGIAIISVILVHAGAGELPGILGQIGSSGARGVQMFFIISAYLSFESAEHFFGDKKDVCIKKALKWYLRKAIRLIPLYYLSIALCLITNSWSTYWLGKEDHITIQNVVAHLLLIHGFFPQFCNSIPGGEWYLGVLVIFLFLTPWLYRFLSFQSTVATSLVILIIKPFVLSYLAVIVPDSGNANLTNVFFYNFNPLAQSLTWMMGLVLYFVRKELDRHKKTEYKSMAYMLLIFSIIMLYGQMRVNPSLYLFESMEMYSLWFALILLSQMLWPSKLVNNAFFRCCGKYSYGMYLLEFIWLNLYDHYVTVEGYKGLIRKVVLSVFGLLLLSKSVTDFIDEPLQSKMKLALNGLGYKKRL